MRTLIIATAAAFGILASQTPVWATCQADAIRRYDGGLDLQHSTAPQRVQALAQADAVGNGHANYGRRYTAGEQTGVDNGAYRMTAAEETGVDAGAPERWF